MVKSTDQAENIVEETDSTIDTSGTQKVRTLKKRMSPEGPCAFHFSFFYAFNFYDTASI
jgi:hypothetical protein